MNCKLPALAGLLEQAKMPNSRPTTEVWICSHEARQPDRERCRLSGLSVNGKSNADTKPAGTQRCTGVTPRKRYTWQTDVKVLFLILDRIRHVQLVSRKQWQAGRIYKETNDQKQGSV